MVNGNYVLYGDRPSSGSEIVEDHVSRPERRTRRPRQFGDTLHNGPQLDNETDSVKYEKKIKEPRLLRYVPTTDVEEHYVNETFESYDLKPVEEIPRRYAFTKKARNHSDGSVNYAYSRSSSSSPSSPSGHNLPTIKEHVEQYGSYRVRPVLQDCPKLSDVNVRFESKLDKYFTKPRDIKFPQKGSHPDSLYRVPTGAGADVSKMARLARTLRWPAALVTVCVALAVFVYFLMPDHMSAEMEIVNSTYWVNNADAQTQTKQRTSTPATTTTVTLARKPGTKTPEIDFYEADDNKHVELASILDVIKDKKQNRKLPAAPVFPTRITPEVQYGNEKADTDNQRSAKVLDKLNDPSQDSTVKPHITHKPEKPLSVYFKDVTNANAATESISKAETANDFNFYDKQADDSKRIPNYQVDEQRAPADYPEPELPIEVQEYYSHASPNGDRNFTSGHSKFFGLSIEDAEKMKSTTQSSVYQTRVSPTLPTWRDVDETTTKRYPVNTNTDALDCHSPRLSICRGVLPYDLAGPAPTIDGVPITDMMPQVEYLLGTNCSARVRQFLCSLLEPECNPAPYSPKMPCHNLCRAVLDYCQGVIPRELVTAFHCKQYPSNNCIGARGPCDARELQCSDGSCVPRDWMCDGTRDCPDGEDEQPCITCEKGQYKCPSSNACIQKGWLCDGYNDCPSGEDEDQLLCRKIQRKQPIAVHQDHEQEETAGSAPAPSIRRPNRLPTNRRGGDESSKELLITSDSGNALKRNYTRRPSPSRLTPYHPKLRQPPPSNPDDSGEKIKPIRRSTTTVKPVEVTASPEEINMEDLGLFDEFAKEAAEKKGKNIQMGVAPGPHTEYKAFESPMEQPIVYNQKPTKMDKSNNKYERVIDGAALLQKAAEEEKKVQSAAESNPIYDDFPAYPGAGGTSHSSPCPSGELRCVEGRCITLAQLCDGTIDCSDHADEDNCYT